jgi:hypothetical protein
VLHLVSGRIEGCGGVAVSVVPATATTADVSVRVAARRGREVLQAMPGRVDGAGGFAVPVVPATATTADVSVRVAARRGREVLQAMPGRVDGPGGFAVPAAETAATDGRMPGRFPRGTCGGLPAGHPELRRRCRGPRRHAVSTAVPRCHLRGRQQAGPGRAVPGRAAAGELPGWDTSAGRGVVPATAHPVPAAVLVCPGIVDRGAGADADCAVR